MRRTQSYEFSTLTCEFALQQLKIRVETRYAFIEKLHVYLSTKYNCFYRSANQIIVKMYAYGNYFNFYATSFQTGVQLNILANFKEDQLAIIHDLLSDLDCCDFVWEDT